MIDMQRSLTLAAAFLVIGTMPAFAYLDPVTGSIIIQAVLGVAAAVMAGVRSIRERIIGIFTGRGRKD
jgi:hypothetical protein